jgi:ADP-ribose pyrophosphatase YjhB (NUDIX family)
LTEPGELDQAAWDALQRIIPIACVDLLPVRLDEGGRVCSIGLILRKVPLRDPAWCLVGGRVRYSETLAEARTRQVETTLGSGIACTTLLGGQPATVAEYAPSGSPRFHWDPRKHAIAITYLVLLEGVPVPEGEALDFRWFGPESGLTRSQVGFDQDQVIDSCLAHLEGGPDQGWWR